MWLPVAIFGRTVLFLFFSSLLLERRWSCGYVDFSFLFFVSCVCVCVCVCDYNNNNWQQSPSQQQKDNAKSVANHILNALKKAKIMQVFSINPLINGHDVIARFGIDGPQIAHILNAGVVLQLQHPKTSKEGILAMLQQQLKTLQSQHNTETPANSVWKTVPRPPTQLPNAMLLSLWSLMLAVQCGNWWLINIAKRKKRKRERNSNFEVEKKFQ